MRLVDELNFGIISIGVERALIDAAKEHAPLLVISLPE